MQLDIIGKFIAQLRKEKELTQKELGEIINIDNKIISKWENGKYAPDITVLKELSVVLGVSITELLDGKRKDQDEIDSDETTVNSLKLYTNQTKKKYMSWIVAILSFLVTLFFVIFGIIKYYEWNITKVHTINNDIFNVEGIIMYNRRKSIYVFKDFEYRNEYVGTTMEPIISSIEVILVINDQNINANSIEFISETPLHTALKNANIYLEESNFVYDSNDKIEIIIKYIDINTKEEISNTLKLK